MTMLPKPSLATAGLLVLPAVFLVLPTAISSSHLRPSSSLRRLDGFGFGGIGDFFDEVFGGAAGSSSSSSSNTENENETENEGTTGDNNLFNGALDGLNINDALDGIGDIVGDIFPDGSDALDGIGDVAAGGGGGAGDMLPGGAETDNDAQNDNTNLGSDLLGNNNDLLAFVPDECMDDGPELNDVVECVMKPTNLFGCLGLLTVLDPDAIPDPSDIEECSDIEEPFCAVVAECEGCGVQIDALMRCIVIHSPGMDGNITELVETCPLDCQL